jgi:hypothetical protein
MMAINSLYRMNRMHCILYKARDTAQARLDVSEIFSSDRPRAIPQNSEKRTQKITSAYLERRIDDGISFIAPVIAKKPPLYY